MACGIWCFLGVNQMLDGENAERLALLLPCDDLHAMRDCNAMTMLSPVRQANVPDVHSNMAGKLFCERRGGEQNFCFGFISKSKWCRTSNNYKYFYASRTEAIILISPLDVNKLIIFLLCWLKLFLACWPGRIATYEAQFHQKSFCWIVNKLMPKLINFCWSSHGWIESGQ